MRIELGEIEAVLRQHLEVEDAMVGFSKSGTGESDWRAMSCRTPRPLARRQRAEATPSCVTCLYGAPPP